MGESEESKYKCEGAFLWIGEGCTSTTSGKLFKECSINTGVLCPLVSQIRREVPGAVLFMLQVCQSCSWKKCVHCGRGGLVLVHGSWIIALTDKTLGLGVCRNRHAHSDFLLEKDMKNFVLSECFYIKPLWIRKNNNYYVIGFLFLERKKNTKQLDMKHSQTLSSHNISQTLSSHNIKELSLTILPKPKNTCMPTPLYHFSQEENIVSDEEFNWWP